MTYSNNMVAMVTQLYVNMQYYMQLNLDYQNLFTARSETELFQYVQ